MSAPNPNKAVTILALASYFKGGRFLAAAHEHGAHVILLTREKLADEAWPMASIDERFLMPSLSQQPDITYAVSYLARDRIIDRIVPLDDYDVLTAAALREHMRLPGLGLSLARRFRDKLAMRTSAREAGLLVPDFVPILNYDRLRAFMEQVPPPWVLKPRTEAGAMGIKRINHSEELWRWLDQLGDEQSSFLLERFVPGEVFHVDSIVSQGEVIFAAVQKYARPPMSVAHQGGVFISHTLPREDEDHQPLRDFNKQVIGALGMDHGVTHTEFIKGHEDRQLYFLETAARVGGASLDVLIEAATGINLWEEWARQETALAREEPYQLPDRRHDHAGLLICLARQEYPDLSLYDEPEVVWRLHKKQHAGLIVASPNHERVRELLDTYSHRFAQDFLAVAPPLDRAPE